MVKTEAHLDEVLVELVGLRELYSVIHKYKWNHSIHWEVLDNIFASLLYLSFVSDNSVSEFRDKFSSGSFIQSNTLNFEGSNIAIDNEILFGKNVGVIFKISVFFRGHLVLNFEHRNWTRECEVSSVILSTSRVLEL